MKSKRVAKLETAYKSKGMSDIDSEMAAVKRAKIEKILKIAAVVTVAAATVYVARNVIAPRVIENGIQKNMSSIFDTAKNRGVTKLSEVPTIKKSHDLYDDLQTINPRFPTNRPTAWGIHRSVWESNCGYCATAFEMRRRGFDVEAVSNGYGMTSITPSSLFKGAKLQSAKPQTVIKEITKNGVNWGDGARGMVNVGWKQGGGHAFSFEIENGLPKFIDPQIGASDVQSYFKQASRVSFVRLDNLDITDNILNAVKIKG